MDITPEDIKQALECPDNFGYSGGNPDMFSTWSLGPCILTRDSGLLAQSNADAMVKALEAIPEIAGDWKVVGMGHWGCGWVEHLTFRAVEPDGSPTRVFQEIMAMENALSEYPVLDDQDYSDREYEATLENIASEGFSLVKEGSPEEWPKQVFKWLWDNDQRELEACDDQGGYPSEKSIRAALGALGMLDT